MSVHETTPESLTETTVVPGPWLTDGEREQLAAHARTAVQATEAGMADLTTGTIRLDDQPPVEGLVVERLDDVAVEADPRWRPVPLLPEALTDPAVRQHRAAVLRSRVGFHALRTPVYAWRAARVTALGARVALRDVWSYQQAGEYSEMIDQARRQEMGHDHVAALRAERRQVTHQRHREPTTILGASGATSYVAALVAIAQVWGVATAAPVLLPLVFTLFLLGRREHRRAGDGVVPGVVLDSAQAAAELLDQPVLGADSINTAFADAGLIKGETGVSLVGPVRAVQMDAAEARVRLPKTLTASKVILAREQLAAALRVDVTWLDITETAEPGVISLWVAASDPLAQVAPSPLLDDPTSVEIDVWRRGVPLGRNRRGETVHMPFRHVNGLLGGTTRSDKGMALRNIIPALGLDPRVRIRLVVGAKPGEHRAYAPVTSTFFGKRPQRLLALLDAMIEEADRREAALEDEGRAKFGERDLNRFPLDVLIIDEFPQYTMSKERIPDPTDEKDQRTLKVGEEIEHRLSKLAAYCTALNMDIVLLAQDPDASTVPRGFRNNTGSRTAFRTNGATQTNAILKDGATGAGLRAHDIKVSQPGVAIVDLDGAEGELLRTFYVPDDRDEDEADPIAPLIAQGVARRRAAGCLAGQYQDPIEEALVAWTGQSSAAGGPTGSGRPGPPPSTEAARLGVLDLILAAVPEGQDRVSAARVREHLADYDPLEWGPREGEDTGQYTARIGRALAAEVAAALAGTDTALEARQVRMPDGSRTTGYLRSEIDTALSVARNSRI